MLTWFKLGGIALVGAVTLSVASFYVGKREGRQIADIDAAKNALVRVQKLEKNNANFRKLSDRDRCLVFMRDSGLPEQECD